MCMQGLFFNEIGCWTRHTRSAEMQEGIASAFHSAKDLKCDNKGFCCMFPSFMPRLLDALNLLLKRRGPSRNVKLSEGRAVNFNVTLESHCTRPGIACVCFSLTHHSQKVKSLGSGAPATRSGTLHCVVKSICWPLSSNLSRAGLARRGAATVEHLLLLPPWLTGILRRLPILGFLPQESLLATLFLLQNLHLLL